MIGAGGAARGVVGPLLEHAPARLAIVNRTPDRAVDLAARMKEIFLAKKAVQPLGAATAGCMFKNPPEGPGAGALLDRAGVKGLAIGGARFSSLHANFVENAGGASYADVCALVREGHRRVLDAFGVDLSLEVKVWCDEEEAPLAN